MTSRKIVIAVCTPCTVVSRSSLMSLIMTFMLDPAKLQMNWARARGTSTRRNDVDCVPDPVCCVIHPPALVSSRDPGDAAAVCGSSLADQCIGSEGDALHSEEVR